MRHKVGIIGHFGGDHIFTDGQTVKTKILAEELEQIFGENSLLRIDTYGWKKHPLMLLINCIKAVRNSDHVVMMTDEGGIKIIPWLLHACNIHRKARLHYIVIGGWLIRFLEKHKFLKTCLRHFDGIYVETRALMKGLTCLDFQNVTLIPNFKSISPLEERDLVFCGEMPYKLCIFSRVMKEKGIEDAVNAVKAVNSYMGKAVFALDIFGQVDPAQEEWFKSLNNDFPPEIRYRGVIPYDQSVTVVKDYFALLFPTRFYTEGIPGTVIDAYASGVPVIAAEWESYADIIVPDVTGISYPFGNSDKLREILVEIAKNPEKLNKMKINCLKKAQEYLPSGNIGLLAAAMISKE